MKICSKCKNPFSLNDFNLSKKGEPMPYCKTCGTKRYKKAHKKRKERWVGKRAEWNLIKKHGITFKDYNMLLEKQEGKCAICDTHQKNLKRRLVVDHDHKTDKIRGLLCYSCNSGLGLFKDDPILLIKASNYLKVW